MPKLKVIEQDSAAADSQPIDGEFQICKPKQKRIRNPNLNLDALHALIVAFGPREAARQVGMKECTVRKIASRKKWHCARDIPGKPGRKPPPAPRLLPVSQVSHQSPAVALGSALTRLKHKSTMGLAAFSARAATALNKAKDPLSVTRKAVDISDVHKTIWPAEQQGQNILQIGFLIQGK